MNISEDKLYKIIGDRIRQGRKELKLTQAELAQRMGFERTSITNIESGKQHTPLHLLYKLCAMLEMDIKSLLPDLAEIMPSRVVVLPSITGTITYADKPGEGEVR
jgi:transcriptional regulator with XRE-family HTH domain